MREHRKSGEIVVERRRTTRAPIRVGLTCSIAGACFTGTTVNLTVHGLFLETEIPVPPDAEVNVVIELPGDEKPVQVSGHVARVARGKNDPPGFAIEFDDLEEPARARITAAVDDALADLG